MTKLNGVGGAPAFPKSTQLRLRYLLLACVTIAVGLTVHTGLLPLAFRARDAAGDALWAMMMFWWIGAALPLVRPMVRAWLAIGVCVAVELSQLYHVPWLDAIRATTPGHLVLGSGFDARDLVAYAVGVLVAYCLDRLMHRATPTAHE